MNRERALGVAAVGVLAVALLAAAVVPGVLANPTDDGPVRPGPVRIAEVAIEPGQVSGQTTELSVETRLAHYDNPTRNVSLRVRAVDAESGLVETTRTVDVGTIEGDREVPVTVNLTVEREGGYRIETVVYRDGERIESGGKRVDGLEALTPEYARTGVAFTESDALPPLSFSVVSTDDDRTTLSVSASLTNRGDDPSEDLRVTVILRQADSNIVADRADVDVGAIRPGRTETVDAELRVPDGYNYYIDAVLWKDGVMVDTARSAANLDPTRRISVNETEREVDLQVSDFESDDGRSPRAEPTQTPMAAQTQAPGFGPLVAVVAVALLSVLALARGRRSR